MELQVLKPIQNIKVDHQLGWKHKNSSKVLVTHFNKINCSISLTVENWLVKTCPMGSRKDLVYIKAIPNKCADTSGRILE